MRSYLMDNKTTHKKPKPGMAYSEVKERLNKHKLAQNNPHFRRSLINQVRLRDGDAAARTLDIETSTKFKKTQVMNALHEGRNVQFESIRSNGWGEGKSCADDPSFERVGNKYIKKYF